MPAPASKTKLPALLAAALCALLATLAFASTAQAAPDITLDKRAPASVLFGDDSRVTLRVANPSEQPYGYNLSLRDVLPDGVSYVPGSGPVEPRIISDAPNPGETTLIFENVSDLSPGSTYDLEYEVSHDTGVFAIGDSYLNQAGAYINDDPHFVPDFGADGTPGGDITGSATDSATTEISAIEIVKDEPSPEGELLRGVHDHQTVYTLTVRNNAIEETDSIDVEDWLPAGLEYLGCGDADNTTDAPTNLAPGATEEYAGSGAIDAPGNAPSITECATPDLVETVFTDPDGGGPLQAGVYTHVVWNDVGSVPANGELRIRYVAAVPLRENTTTWPGLGAPDPAGLLQTSNLDNNSGPETEDEQALTNFATVQGSYDGSLAVSDDHALTRSAEDLAVQKGVSTGAIDQNEISTWSLHIETSEYRYSENVRVEDTLPDGLCPLDAVENHEGGGQTTTECDPFGGNVPSHDYTSATENPDGSYTLVWDSSTVSDLQLRQPSSELTITFPTRTRTHYQEDFGDAGPVLAEDSWENHVAIEGLTSRICAPADPDCTGSADKIDGDLPEQVEYFDVSEAGQEAGPVTLDKRIMEATPTVVDCNSNAYSNDLQSYGPGDLICWQLRIDFPTDLDSGEPRLTDFLPPGTTYVDGSAQATPSNNVSSTFDDSAADTERVLTWDLGTEVDPGRIFEWRFATRLAQSPTDELGDIHGNLMKLSYANTAGTTFPLRDQVDFTRSQARLDLVKGVKSINTQPDPGNGPNVDGGNVAAFDFVDYRIDVTNSGDLDASNVIVQDVLQDGITCADVAIPNGGTCADGRIEWTVPSIPAGETTEIVYTILMPSWIEPGKRFDNVAGVASYESDVNTGGTFTYVPENNIDPTAPTPNAPAADDDSFVTTRDVTLTKERETTVDEGGNNLLSEATIGERIDYKVTVVVPEGTTIDDASLNDNLGPRHGFPLDATGTLNGGALPPDVVIGASFPNNITVDFPDTYVNAAGSGDDTFEFTISARVADVADNHRADPHHTLPNSVAFFWEDQDATPHVKNASVDTTIVEPNVTVGKTDDDEDGTVEPGQEIDYTVTATNATGARVSTAHDLEVVDHVPDGLTPIEPIADGGSWDSGTRTITWTIPSLAPGASEPRTYTVTVDDPATAGEVFTNTVDLTATSLAGAASGERGIGSPIQAGYVADAEDTLQLEGAALTKSVDPTSATIGDQATYTLDVTLPANINYFDTTVIDTLPDGLVFDQTVEAECDGAPCAPGVVTEVGPEPEGDGSRVAWFIGDLSSQGTERNYRITYTAHVADEYTADASDVLAGQTLVNEAEVAYNGSDQLGTPTSPPAPNGFTGHSEPDDATVTVTEPSVTIDKDVSGDANDDDARDTQPGDSYTYSLVVHNGGTAPAYDVEVTDTPDAALLRNIAPVANPAVNVTDGVGGDGSLGWTIPGPIAPGASVTITYTADLALSNALSQDDTVVNTADVARYWGVPEADRTADPDRDYREYTDVPDDTVTLDVHLPELTVQKTTGGAGFPESAVAQVGETFPWRVTVTNASTHAAAESVDVSDVLPANWTYVPNSASFAPGGAAEPTIVTAAGGDELTWSDVADLDPGEQIVLTFQARPTVAAIGDPGTGAGSPNVNDADASGVDVSGASASADGPYADDDSAQAVLELPELSISKTPDDGAVDAGDPVSYSIEIANDGDVPARDVVVSDVLGEGQTYTGGAATAVPADGFSETSVEAGPGAGETTVEWAIDEIPAGGSVTITVPAATDPSLPAASGLVNDASVSSREITTPISDDGGYSTSVESDVGIVKEAQTDPVDAGEEMDFTLTVTNHGPSDATGVEIEDDLPANLTFVSAESPCAEDAGDPGLVTCAIGDLAAGDSVELTLRVAVSPDETVQVSNTATVTSTTPDSNDTNDSSTATKPVGVDADVSVVKDGPTEPVLQGTDFDYTIRVVNEGVSAATAVTLSDPLPAGVSFVDVVTDVGTCDEDSGTIECDLGTLEPGADAEITVTVTAVDVGAPVNTATADTTATETNTDNNDDDATVTIVPAADLGVTKTAPPTADAGSEIPYELGVRNNGPSPATGVTLVDTLPPGVEFVSADPECLHAAGLVTCTVGDLAVDESRTYTVTVGAPFSLGDQTLTNSVVVNGNEGDLVSDNDSAQAETTIGPAADLSIAKTAGGATAGGTASWTLAVRNDGPSTATPVTVVDTLPAGTTLRSATPSQGGCGAAGGEVTCNLGALSADGAAQITIVADVAADAVGQRLLNRATVGAPQPDPDPSNNEDEVSSTVVAPPVSGPNLALSKVASSRRPELGKPFSYRIEVANNGDAAATGVRVLDTLNKSVSLRRVTTSAGKCSDKGAQVTCKLGTLAAGGHADIRLVVIPRSRGLLRNTASVLSANGGEVDTADNSDMAGVRVAAVPARWTLAKRASRRAVRGGQTVRFAITVRAYGQAVANARVCDRLPSGLVFVRARGARFENGRACWRLRYLAPGGRRTLRVVTRAERGFNVRQIRNVVVGRAFNARRRSASAPVRIDPAFGGAGGGVTG